MLKRAASVIMTVCMLLCTFACTPKNDTSDSDGSGSAEHIKSGLLGFIAQENGEVTTYEAMHGFICSAGDVGMNAKLYKFANADELSGCVENAIKDNCDAVLLYGEGIDFADEAKKLENKGIRTVSLASKCESASCNIILERSDAEVIEALADKAAEGSVLIYCNKAPDSEGIQKQLSDRGVEVSLKYFIRSEQSDAKARKELDAYLEEHTTVTAIYAKDAENAVVAAKAAKSQDRKITVIGCEFTDENAELLGSGIYALVVPPYYDMAGRAVRVMQKLANGQACDDEYCTVHLVTADKKDKYTSVRKNTVEWFDIQG